MGVLNKTPISSDGAQYIAPNVASQARSNSYGSTRVQTVHPTIDHASTKQKQSASAIAPVKIDMKIKNGSDENNQNLANLKPPLTGGASLGSRTAQNKMQQMA